MTTPAWITHVLELTVLLCINQVHSGDIRCKGSHKEITFPELFIKDNIYGQIPASEDDPLLFKFSWRGELLSAVLESHVITSRDGLYEKSPDDNTTEAELLDSGQKFYQGYVRGKKFSFVALTVSTGLTGYIQVNREGVYIEPVGTTFQRATLGPHVLRSCGRVATPRHDGLKHKEEVDIDVRSDSGSTWRRRRSAPRRYLEVLLVADTKTVEMVGELNVKTYLLTLMNIVNMLYHDETLGTSLEVVTVKIKYLDKATERRVIYTGDPKRTVDEFCNWVHYGSGARGGPNHDVAVLISRAGFTPAGYAPITGLCVPMRNCALVKDDGFTSAFVAAHEIGHIFGLMHDGHGNTCYGREYQTSLMATQVQSSFTNYWWSGCSKKRMAEVIGHLTCLNNNPNEFIPDRLIKPVGISWTLDEQCRLEFGEPAAYCPFFGGRTPCTQLWCTDGTTRKYTCKSKHVAPLDGTQCGPSTKWYCLQGACGYHGNEKPVDGGWGSWNAWSDCSSKCGIGFMRRFRLCDNPEPKFNGNTCDGLSENTDTCKSKDCTDYVDMRAYQCSSMDSAVVNGVTHRWLPYQVKNEADFCKLTCISETTSEIITFNTFVDNATPCSYDGPTGICINGKCERVGCDGVKGSSKREDRCGVCDGDGSSCKTVSGSYTKAFEYSAAGVHYEKVLELPIGARNLTILEQSRSPHFLSMEDTAFYKQVINADGKQGRSKEFVLEGAWFSYNNNAGRESLASKGPLHKPVNVLIYPMDWQKSADVTYTYTVGNEDFTYEKNRYHWRFESWSPCSITCGKGVQNIIYKCYDKDTDSKADDDKCKYNDPPSTEEVECEMIDCASVMYGWRMLRDFTECSATCGEEGTRHRQYECELFSEKKAVGEEFCIHIPEPIFPEACNRVPCELPKYSWEPVGKWSECSQTCGEAGSQYQLVRCIQALEGKTTEVEDRLCSDIKGSKVTRQCNRRKCVEYRWVLTKNWSECNAPCGKGGMQRRKTACWKYVNGQMERLVSFWFCSKTDVPSETRECNVHACFDYRWGTIERWSECSHSCGDEGFRSKQVVCKNVTYDDRERNVDDVYCKNEDRPVVLENCNRIECDTFEWRVLGEWGPECQSVCNENYTTQQTRQVACYQIFPSGQQEQTDNDFCDKDTKPETVQECPDLECPVFEWSLTDEWSACSTTCGPESVQTETVRCQEIYDNGTATTVDDSKCPSTKPAAATRACDVTPCASYKKNDTAAWSDCSETCETGVQFQMLTCVMTSLDSGEEQAVPEVHCRNAGLELPARACHAGPCGWLEWEAGPWSQCSVSCGPGKQKRAVMCGKPEFHANRSRCPGKAPSEYKHCENDCDESAKKTDCIDRAPFCKRANERLCGATAFTRVCCLSCRRVTEAQKRSSVRRRRLRHLLRSYMSRRRRNRGKNRRKRGRRQ